MIAPHPLMATAMEIQKRLGEQPFISLHRSEVTTIMREVSEDPTARIRERKAAELEASLSALNISCFPSLIGTGPADIIRFFHADTALAHFVDLLVEPTANTDNELSAMLTRIKSQWDWSAKAA